MSSATEIVSQAPRLGAVTGAIFIMPTSKMSEFTRFSKDGPIQSITITDKDNAKKKIQLGDKVSYQRIDDTGSSTSVQSGIITEFKIENKILKEIIVSSNSMQKSILFGEGSNKKMIVLPPPRPVGGGSSMSMLNMMNLSIKGRKYKQTRHMKRKQLKRKNKSKKNR